MSFDGLHRLSLEEVVRRYYFGRSRNLNTPVRLTEHPSGRRRLLNVRRVTTGVHWDAYLRVPRGTGHVWAVLLDQLPIAEHEHQHEVCRLCRIRVDCDRQYSLAPSAPPAAEPRAN
jgi:hypothetical protein